MTLLCQQAIQAPASFIFFWLLLHPLPLPHASVLGEEKEGEEVDRPHFDSILPSYQTVQQGDTAYLHCKIFTAHNM